MDIGIFDIGTKAVRLLIGSDKQKKIDFSFDNFRNYGNITLLGESLKNDKFHFKSPVIRTINQINKFKSMAKKEGYNINKWYGVGTSVFRDAQNSKLVIDMIKKETDIDIEILSKEDEAKYSLYAIIFSFAESIIKTGSEVMLIDQGGGSTEIASCNYIEDKGIEINMLDSLDLGTVRLKKSIFNSSNYNKNFDEIYNDLIQESKKIIDSHKKINTTSSLKVFGLGSGITQMTNKQGNRKQHGTIIHLDDINRIAEETLYDTDQSNFIWKLKPGDNSNYPDGIKLSISDMIDFTKSDKKYKHHFEDSLNILLGSVAYGGLIDYYNADYITVAGTGLRYGVYYSRAILET